MTLQPFAIYSNAEQPIIVLVALLVCLIPTTIGGLLSAIGIAGMDRLVQRNVLAMSGRAVEAAGDVTTLLLDKTGTITFGARQAAELLPVHDVTEEELAEAALASSLADETPEGRSIVEFVHEPLRPRTNRSVRDAVMVPFTAQTRMSGMDFPAATGVPARSVRKGAAESVRGMVADGRRRSCRSRSARSSRWCPRDGATPLVVTDQLDGQPPRILGVIRLKDTVKPGHDRALRPDAGDGHPHRDDHRRQPADGGGDRRARPASTTSSPRRRPRTRWRSSGASRRAATSSR